MGQTRELVSCRTVEGSKAQWSAVVGQGGFTLFELLIVVAIMATLVAIALPELERLFTRVLVSFQLTDIERQLLALPQRVRVRGRNGVLFGSTEGDGATAQFEARTFKTRGGVEEWERLNIDLPHGWVLDVPSPVFYRLTGACSGGRVDLSYPPVSYRYVLTAPLCRPQLAVTDGH